MSSNAKEKQEVIVLSSKEAIASASQITHYNEAIKKLTLNFEEEKELLKSCVFERCLFSLVKDSASYGIYTIPVERVCSRTGTTYQSEDEVTVTLSCSVTELTKDEIPGIFENLGKEAFLTLFEITRTVTGIKDIKEFLKGIQKLEHPETLFIVEKGTIRLDDTLVQTVKGVETDALVKVKSNFFANLQKALPQIVNLNGFVCDWLSENVRLAVLPPSVPKK